MNRVVFYGVTVLLGIGAFFQILQSFASRWPSYIDALIALLTSAVEMQITTLRPYNARYTGDHRCYFRV